MAQSKVREITAQEVKTNEAKIIDLFTKINPGKSALELIFTYRDQETELKNAKLKKA